MKKLFTICCLATLLFSGNAYSQISIGAGVGILNQIIEDVETDAHFGGEIYAKFEVSDAFRVGASLGFYNKTTDVFGFKVSTKFIPVSVSGEYLFLDGNLRPYVGVHLGTMLVASRVDSEEDSEGYFNVSPVAGIEFNINDNLGLNLNVKYGVTFLENGFGENDTFTTLSPNVGFFYRLEAFREVTFI